MTQKDSSLTDEETLDILLDDWDDAVERGSSPVPEIICKDHPHLLADFITKTNLIAQIDGNMLDAESSSEPVRNQAFIEAPPSQNLNWKSHISQLNYHAHGGLGIVFRGFDQQLHRNVAIKFVRKRRRNNPLDVQRFRIEAEITSRLDHPGVAPVHGFGYTDTGVPFYAMRMVEGQTLQQRIEAFHSQIKKEPHTGEQSVEFRKLLSSFVSVCNTIEYTHNRGIVNCDIKPGNIMMGKYGETVVLDWGCAKYVGSDGKAKSAGEESLNPQSDTEQNGSTGGTPIYMSPEQHSQKEIGPSSDIYCLGATLYRIVTGQAAFSPEFSLPKIRELVIRGNFSKPTSRCPWVSKALEAICLKAMSLRPVDRYQSAAQMARDLERYLADEEVDAYTEPLSRRFARLMRRHRGVSQILMISVALIILITSVSAVMMRNLAINESLAKEQANLMQNRSLQSAARSAATAMALKINDAWRVLEIESSAELLHHELEDRMESDQFGPGGDLQDWLTEKSILHQQATQAASWFICDAKGMQIARYPYFEDPQMKKVYESIGKNFSHRDYFHGNGYDLSQGERSDPTNINDVHLSAVYKSSNTASLKVAFSIPIWSDHTDLPEREFMGILGYSVELGQFAVLQDDKDSESFRQKSILVDMRNHGKSLGKSQFGLILQHPDLKETLHSPSSRLDTLHRLATNDLDHIEAYRQKRVERIRESGFAASISDVLLLKDYQDPFTADSSGSTAACEPVCVIGRSKEGIFDTGWLVLIEEFSESDAVPNAK